MKITVIGDGGWGTANAMLLAGYGLEITARVPIVSPPTAHDTRYLNTKKEKMGHLI